MMKKIILLSTTLGIMTLMVGCMKVDSGIVINNDGTGKIYNKTLVGKIGSINSSNEFFKFTNEAVVDSFKETIDDKKYIGETYTQDFDTLSDIKHIADGFDFEKTGNIVMVSMLMPEEVDEEEY